MVLKTKIFVVKKKLKIDGQMNGWTDQWMDGRMDGQTRPFVKMHCGIIKQQSLNIFALHLYSFWSNHEHSLSLSHYKQMHGKRMAQIMQILWASSWQQVIEIALGESKMPPVIDQCGPVALFTGLKQSLLTNFKSFSIHLQCHQSKDWHIANHFLSFE